MEKLYNKIDFVNNTTPALNATNLNRMSKGLDDVDTRVVNLAANIMEAVPEIREDIEIIQADMSAVEGYKDQAEESAEDAEAWAVGTRDGEPVPSTDPAYENSSKYWAEQSHISAGVTSFNGRAGSVTPQSGDYTASQVGALGNDGSNAASTVTLGGDLNVVGNYRKNGSVFIPGHMIVDSADNYMPQRGNLKFEGATVTDNSLDDETVITMSASGKADISAIGYNETGSTCSKSGGYTTGDNFYKDGKFCTAIATIAQGATFTENTNYVKGTIADAITSLNSGLSNVITMKELIPELTSNTSASGITVSASSCYNTSNFDAYGAFNDKIYMHGTASMNEAGTRWNSQFAASVVNEYLAVTFSEAKIVTMIRLCPFYYTYDNALQLKDFKIQGSNNGTDWTDLFSGSFLNQPVDTYITINSVNKYTRYRLLATSNSYYYANNVSTISISRLQFYGY